MPLDISEKSQYIEQKENIEIANVKIPGKKGKANDSRPYFQELIQALREFQTLHGTYEFDWNAIKLPEGTKYKDIVMSIFPEPKSSEGKGSNWLNLRKSQRRKILWLEVRRKNKYTDIVELDRKTDENYAIYFLTYKGGRKASANEISQVMILWASNQIYCSQEGLREHGKLPWDRKGLNHKNPEKLVTNIWERLN